MHTHRYLVRHEALKMEHTGSAYLHCNDNHNYVFGTVLVLRRFSAWLGMVQDVMVNV